MSRKSQIVETLGLGPVWQVRDTRLAAHPAISWLHAPEPAEATPPVAVSEPVAASAPLAHDTIAATPSPVPAHRADHETQPAPTAVLPAEPLGWEDLERTVQACQLCRLCNTRTQAVFGRGNRHARWMIVGEAPGEQEDRQGLPFVGRAGKLLDNLLAAAGLSPQDDVFIANVLKCRPPGNRNPAGDEIAACQPYLQQQIAHIQPDIILALGRFAAQTLLQTELSISRLRGKVHDYQGHPLIVSYHPAYLLRNPPDKAKAWQDWVLAKRTLK